MNYTTDGGRYERIFAHGTASSTPTTAANAASLDAARVQKYMDEADAAGRALSHDKTEAAVKRAWIALHHCGSAANSARPTDAARLREVIERTKAIIKGSQETDRELAAQLTRQGTLFHDVDGTAYASIIVREHRENVPVRSRRFKSWLTLQFREAKGKAPSADALSVAQNEAEALATLEGPQEPVFTRLAYVEGRMYVDLCDDAWRAVEIDVNGWRVVDNPPVKFVRPTDARPLPTPAAGGSLEELRRFVNVASDDDWHMLVAWLVGAMAPDGPYPILMLYGEQGSAKSSTARALRSLIDPAGTATRKTPKNEHDLAIAARRCRVLVFDNLSSLSTEMSDAFCRLATGGGLGTRKLYTDDEEATFYAKRPVVINGIEEVATRGDLLDRAVVLQLPKLEPDKIRDEATMRAEFEDAHPRLLAALLDHLSTALAQWDTTRLEIPPRMADFARWVEASKAVPDFLFLYGGNRMQAIGAELEASTFAAAVLEVAGEHGDWKGSAADLLGQLNLVREPSERGRDWPDTPNKVGSRLRRFAPALRAHGVEVNPDGRSNGKRYIELHSADTVPTSAVWGAHSAGRERANGTCRERL